MVVNLGKIFYLVKLFFWFSFFIQQLLGCVTPIQNYLPDSIPHYVREIRTVRVQADGNLTSTGIVIQPGELLSVMATGKIRLSRSSRLLYPSSCSCLLMQIADSTPTLALLHRNARTFASSWEGELSFKIYGAQASFMSAYFDVTVVIWKTKDYSLIADFLDKLEKIFPNHPGIYEASIEASTLKDLQLEKEITSEKIKKTQDQISEIKSKKTEALDSEAVSRAKRLPELQNELETLIAKIAELDELARQIQEQRDLSANIAGQLQMMDQREKELASKISETPKALPLLLITEPEDNSRHETETIRLAGAVEDDSGIAGIEIQVNGRREESDQDRSLKTASGEMLREVKFERFLPLASGVNRIEIRATDIDGLVVQKIVTVHYDPVRRNVWAVVVGINDYPKLPRLKYAVNDAAEFQRLLVERNRVPAENIFLLLNAEATLGNLRSILGTRLRAAAGKGDMVFIFFAGHGAAERDSTSPDGDGLEKYLLAYDSDPADLFSTAMPMRDIAVIFNRIRSERLIFIADACHSGASGGRTVGTDGIRANISDTFLERLAGGRGKVIMTASAANEVSIEKDELQHGVFTYYLLDGLRGAADTDRDGAVSVDEAYRYVSEKVPRATGQEQHPMKKGSLEGSLVLVQVQ